MLKIPAIIVDVDGTLAKRAEVRGPFDYDLSHMDEPYADIFELVNLYKLANYKILVVSGREDICREITGEWLLRHGLRYDELFMRKASDYRQDAIVKQEIYQNLIAPFYDIRVVIDDRVQVVVMWRSLGLRVLQVAPGDF